MNSFSKLFMILCAVIVLWDTMLPGNLTFWPFVCAVLGLIAAIRDWSRRKSRPPA